MAKGARWFSAGALIELDSKSGKWMVFGRTSKEAPGVRFPGGCEEPELNERSPEETLVREYFGESQRYNPYEYSRVYSSPDPIREPHASHRKIWYIIMKTAGTLDFNYKADGVEPDGEHIYLSWWSLEDFIINVAPTHKEALYVILKKLAENDAKFRDDLIDLGKKNSKFYLNNMELFDQL